MYIILHWYVFCLLVVLRKPNRGEGIISTKPRPKSVYDFLVYCIV